MRIHSIVLKNVLALEHLEVKPGAVTVATGGNGVGKSSLLEGVKAVFKGGTDATLLRKGATEGEAVIVLDDQTTLRRRLKADGSSDLTVADPKRGKTSRPQSFVDALVDPLALNPVDFLTAEPRERLELLLQAVPMEVGPAELAEVLGDAVATPQLLSSAWRPGEHALVALDGLRRTLYDERTGVNRSALDKRKAARELEATLPAGGADETTIREQLDAVAREQAHLETERLAQLETARQAKSDGLNGAAAVRDQAEREARADHLAALERAKATLDERLEDARRAFDDRRAALEESWAKVNAQLEADGRERREQLAADAGRLAAERDQVSRARGLREAIEKSNTEATRLELRREALAGALERIDAHKAKLAERIPIAGLTVADGQVRLDDVPFDRANAARRVEAAIELALLRRGELGLVICDGLEQLDPESFEAFVERAQKSGATFIGARVTEGPLQVEARS